MSGEHRLDPMLAAIADGARRLTGASGAALAMWKDGAMVCRARSGETAPPLGAKLSSETGISGECLRSGKTQHCVDTENSPLVDVEVCRSLGLRSIAVLPIQGWRGINGILEVFSRTPAAFTDHHLAILDQLAALAERARATQPHGATPVSVHLPVDVPRPAGILPASDRLRDVVPVFIGGQSKPVVLGAIGLAAATLVGFVIWLGWHGSGDSDGKAHAAAPAAVTSVRPATGRIPDNDPVWSPNPGGESLVVFGGKTSAGTPVRLASKVDVIEGKKPLAESSLLVADAASVALPRAAAAEPTREPAALPTPPTEDSQSLEPPVLSAGQADASSLNGVLVAKAYAPGLAAPVSQGVSGGQLLRRVSPPYPAQARTQRLQGKVVLSALVAKDGTVRNLKLIDGTPTLAQSAMDAVKQWRYSPFVLDGKVIERETTITIDFRLPSSGQ
jgi:TonB family protein